MTASASYSFPPADDALIAASALVGHLARVDWRHRSLAGVDAVFAAVAVCHALLIRALPHVAAAAARVATVAAAAAAPAPVAVALSPKPVPAGTVAQLRSLARSRGLRSVDGRPVKYASRSQLLAVLA